MSSGAHKSPKQYIHFILHAGGVEEEFRLHDHSNNGIVCILHIICLFFLNLTSYQKPGG